MSIFDTLGDQRVSIKLNNLAVVDAASHCASCGAVFTNYAEAKRYPIGKLFLIAGTRTVFMKTPSGGIMMAKYDQPLSLHTDVDIHGTDTDQVEVFIEAISKVSRIVCGQMGRPAATRISR